MVLIICLSNEWLNNDIVITISFVISIKREERGETNAIYENNDEEEKINLHMQLESQSP